MRLFLPFSGDDVFISYSRRDDNEAGERYAVNLYEELKKRGFSSFLDRLGTEPSPTQPESLNRKIRNSKMLIIVGTEKACQSTFVEGEIKEFLKVHRIPVVPIDFNGTVPQARWYPLIEGVTLELEPPETLETGIPSNDVITRIEEAFKYTKRNDQLRKATIGTLALLTLLVLLSGAASVFAWQQLGKAKDALEKAEAGTQKANEQEQKANDKKAEADRQTEIARLAKEDAIKQKEIAEQEKSKADKATELADKKDKLAQEKTKLADEKTKIADLEAKRADVEKGKADIQTKIAEAKRKEAEKQKAITDATRFSNESAELLAQSNPALFKESLKKAVEANQIVEKNNLSLIEPISSLRKVLFVSPIIVEESFESSLTLGILCDQTSFSVNNQSFACRKDNEVEIFQISKSGQPSKKIDFSSELRKLNERENKIISFSALQLSVSDEGNRVAVSYKFNDGTYDSFGIIVIDLNGNSYYQKTDEIKSILLSPDGKSLIYSNIYTTSEEGVWKNQVSLKIWKAGVTEPEYLSTGFSTIKSNFSPDGKSVVAASEVPFDSSNTEVRIISLNDRNDELAKCRSNTLFYGIPARFDEINRIAVNNLTNSGTQVAIESSGISIWNAGPAGTKLKTLIPSLPSGKYVSFGFDNNPNFPGYSLITLSKDKTNGESRKWRIRLIDTNHSTKSPFDSDIRQEDFVLDHPVFKAEISGTQIIIIRKSNSVIIDRIDFGEKIEKVLFLNDGTEIFIQSYQRNELTNNLEQTDKESYNKHYRIWYIGFEKLKYSVNKILQQPQLQ